MNAFRMEIEFEEKTGFTEEGLKNAIIKNLAECQLKLLSFKYQKDGHTEALDFFPISKTYSICECLVEVKSFGSTIPYHQIVLGGIQCLPQEYPYFEIHGIDPSMVEI